MPRRNVFVKISGDVVENDALDEWLRALSKETFVVVCVGGGTQINNALYSAGYPLRPHGPLGRELVTFKERQLVRDVLETNQALLQDRLAEKKIRVTVVIPVQEWGTVLCHMNGDEAVRAAYLGFDELFVVTVAERIENKALQFADLPKVKVIAL